jgi:DNA repair protein SbcC/Rad50
VLITRVELQNIKSYRSADVTLRRGTTAIRGHNGAGKSTLLEAIGWALFDALPYSQAQFVREGERTGQVTVTFRSAEDDREYQVVRRAGSTPVWYVYDPELDHRPAEQKTDVLDFLRRHLCVEGEITLESLFNDALGVAQGRLTADFLETAAHRKKKFDALLQVEDFSRAAEKLRDTRSYLQDALRDQDAAIANLERETAQLDAWRTDLSGMRERERALDTRLVESGRQLEETTIARDALLQQQRKVEALERARDVARVTWEAAQRAVQVAQAHVDEAEEAAKICAAARPDHETYQRTEAALAQGRERAKVRDYRLKQRADLDRALAAATRDVENARHRLEEALAAEHRVVELAPRVAEQSSLLQRREALARDVARLADARATLEAREAEDAALSSEIATLQERIAAIESQRPEAAQLATRTARVESLQMALATRAERQRRLEAVTAELPGLANKRAKTAERLAKASDNVTKLLARRELAESVPTLEAEHERLQTEARRLQAMIDHHTESRAQSVGGHCPFLREPCQNIRQRGLQSLETYFDRLIQQDSSTLAPIAEQVESVAAQLERAREAARWYERLDMYREQQTREAQQLAELDERLASLNAERDDLNASMDGLGSEQELEKARALYERSAQADGHLHELGPLQSALQISGKRQQAVRQELERARALVSSLAGAPDALGSADAALKALGDPQAESTQAAGLARTRPAIEAELGRHEAAREAAAARVAQADEALKPFVGLDAEIAGLEAALGAATPGHQRYLQHVRLAERLGERRATLAEAERQEDHDSEAHHHAGAAYAAALSAFDAGALEQATQRANDLREDLSRTDEALKNLHGLIAERTAAIARAEGFLDDLAAARTERATLAELFQMLDQFRNTIKEAGPYVMRALLRQISAEANRIFGEILGDRSSQLSWEDDYEIMLRRAGQERHYAQLSGGEQMCAALAVRLALLRSLSRLDIAFFDEPTQNMDGERRGNLAEQIRRVHGFDQLIVISHDDTFEQGLDSVIHLEKRGGETILVEEEALVEA